MNSDHVHRVRRLEDTKLGGVQQYTDTASFAGALSR